MCGGCLYVWVFKKKISLIQVFPVVQTVNSLPAMQDSGTRSLGWEDPLEKGMAIHPSILVWRIP